jgi:phosphate uptake regulator
MIFPRRLMLTIPMLVSTALAATDLDWVMAERNLERRSDRALRHAHNVMDRMRETYRSGDWKQVLASLDEILEAVKVARTSLDETGRNPRRNPKYFKRAEQRTRDLIKRVDGFAAEVNFQEREVVHRLHEQLQKYHDQFLNDVMGRRKKT